MFALILLVASIIGSGEPFNISWNMFQSSSCPEFSIIGFGDWCDWNEGPHPGLDFKPPVLQDSVLSPADCQTWIQSVFFDATGYTILIDDEAPRISRDLTGWTISHCTDQFDPSSIFTSFRLLSN